MEISQPLAEIDWIPRPRLLALRRLGLETVENVLTHFPRRHEDRHQFPQFPREESDTPVCLCGEVVNTQLRRFGGWKKIFEVTLQESGANALSQPLICRWFNLHYVQKMIATGQQLVVFGKPRLRGKRICMDHPEFEVIENDEEMSIHFRRITPVYPATEGLSQRALRGLTYRFLRDLSDEPVKSSLPAALSTADRREAIRAIHFPKSWAERDAAREHLVLEEFFAMQMLIAWRRETFAKKLGVAHRGEGKLLDKFLQSLPFTLTAAQSRVIGEVRRDLATDHPMNRLLQGDVGSGKTVVAIAAMLLAVESGFQAALMAPTQILAEQHYSVLRAWLEPLGVRLALRTATRQEESGPLPLFAQAQKTRDLGSTGCEPVVSGSLPDTSALRSSEVSGQAAPKNRLAACAPQNAVSELSGVSEPKYHRRPLPHFERPWAKYAITFATRNHRQLSHKTRDIILESLLRWKETRYELYAACVMPDHVHLLIEPAIEKEDENGQSIFFSLSKILHGIKSFTATRINKIDKTKDPVWETESFDRMIRSEQDLQEKFRYITQNPWDAGVVKPTEKYAWVWWPGNERESEVSANGLPAGRRKKQASGLCSPESRISPTDPQIIIGTHALLYEGVSFSNLGLVVIDEQHKFGVAQRARLTARDPAPDVLVMTATPIPRTLTMTVYGDLDVSVIDEMPGDRGKIVTAVRDETKLGQVLGFLRTQLEAGRQVYVVYPLIEESDKLDVKAAAAEYERWRERLHPYPCELLHGRIAAPEKQLVMERFRGGQTKALISTTVIEVGIDVPNATVMLVENAERFGLAQLHQLRGRIGRGTHKSFCILLSSDPSAETAAKLAVLEKTANGFEIAEADWDLRGPGDLLGTAQSGLPALKMGNLKKDAGLMRKARAVATLILQKDPSLRQSENQHFRRLIVEQQGRTFSNVS
ncbi:MAG: ATP-dependent helicase RecG [Verrucomicrobiota bacterium]|jgi:RecG-like helicase/REP element-mobilizing transposase RayT